MTTIDLWVTENSISLFDAAERRSKARLELPFPIIVRGTDPNNVRFEMSTVIENLSAGGLYVHLEREVEPSAKLFCLICFSPSAQDRGATRIAARGVVLRTEPCDGAFGVAVRFTQHRLLLKV